MKLEDIAETFRAAIAHLAPISDREGRYNHTPVRVRTYAVDADWPEALVASARSVVFRRGSVVVVRERGGYRHVVPGGRREAGESIDQTVRREVLEECGWRVGLLRRFGFAHLDHLGERPADFPFPSGFINPIFLAEGLSYDRSARDLTQSEAGASLVPIGRALQELPPWGAALLQAAAAARAATEGT